MSAPGDEAVAGRVDEPSDARGSADCATLSDGASASLDVNPFVGEGGAYASVRPAYPGEAVAALVDAARRARGVDASGRDGSLRAADIGAGTGKMSELLARAGAVVDAVEPSGAMRAQASSIPGVTWHAGVAEETTLPDAVFDIVVFAQ